MVCEKYAELIGAQGGEVRTSTKVVGIRTRESEAVIETSGGAMQARAVINCAGLFSDRIARMAGERPEVQIVPFRGEYYDMVPERAGLVRALIYPVPDPRFPFLGCISRSEFMGTWTPGRMRFLRSSAKGIAAEISVCGTRWSR